MRILFIGRNPFEELEEIVWSLDPLLEEATCAFEIYAINNICTPLGTKASCDHLKRAYDHHLATDPDPLSPDIDICFESRADYLAEEVMDEVDPQELEQWQEEEDAHKRFLAEGK